MGLLAQRHRGCRPGFNNPSVSIRHLCAVLCLTLCKTSVLPSRLSNTEAISQCSRRFRASPFPYPHPSLLFPRLFLRKSAEKTVLASADGATEGVLFGMSADTVKKARII